jgi:hypothetical protein
MGESAAIWVILSMLGDVAVTGAAAAVARLANPAREPDDLGAGRDRLARARFARDGDGRRFFAVAAALRFVFVFAAFDRDGFRFDAALRFDALGLALRMIPSRDDVWSLRSLARTPVTMLCRPALQTCNLCRIVLSLRQEFAGNFPDCVNYFIQCAKIS